MSSPHYENDSHQTGRILSEEQAARAVLYDFRRPNRISKEKMRTIQAIMDRLSGALDKALTALVRSPVTVRIANIQEVSFGTFAAMLEKPATGHVFYLGAEAGCKGVLDFGRVFPQYLIDRLFGGSGDNTPMDRPLTHIERDAVLPVARRIMDEFSDVWRDYITFAPQFEHFEFMPEVLEIVHREDPVMIATFAIGIVSPVSPVDTQITLCIPIQAIEGFLLDGTAKASYGSGVRSSEEDRGRIMSTLSGSEVMVSVRYPRFRLQMLDLLGLCEQDVLFSAVRSGEPMVVVVNRKPFYLATQGKIGNRVAVRINEAITDHSNHRMALPMGRVVPGPKGETMNTENTGSVDLPSLQDDRTQGGAAASRDMLSNIVVEVSIVIGKTKMPLQEIMNLSRGATVGVDTLVGEPSGLYVNNRKFAEVEVVVIDEHFGFRITRILPGGVASED